MKLIVDASINTLRKSIVLLNRLTNQQLRNNSIPPYCSSIGSHFRHILDFYDCVLNQNNNIVDLTLRRRDDKVENSCYLALDYLNTIINKLDQLKNRDNKELIVIDDLGLGKIEIKYTFSGLLAQANSHAIHHYAIISYILERLGLSIEDDTFGYNPTTPKNEVNLS